MDGVVESSKIHSTQNGLLMSVSLHERFAQYLFSINPDVSILGLDFFLSILTQQKDGYKLLHLLPITGE